MKVLAIKELDDCIESASACTFVLDSPLDMDLVNLLAEDAELQHYSMLPRPLVRIKVPRVYLIQGIVGERELTVTFLPKAPVNQAELLKARIEMHSTAELTGGAKRNALTEY